MTWYSDLSPWGARNLISIGWLEPGKDYAQGEVAESFSDKLVSLLADPWQPYASAGYHDCGFCRLSTGPRRLTYKGTTVELGGSNLFVPGSEVIFVAPSLIAHYIDSHGYAPPAEFQAAVMACPEMRSMAYLKAIRANAPKGFLSTKG